jgi:HEAT repeat protein
MMFQSGNQRLHSPGGSDGAQDGTGPDATPDAAPMTWSLLGRFFGVPLVIIGTIVGGAVFVVLLFGGPAAPEKFTIDQLLQALESSGGERSAGILLPQEKALWQRAVELSQRLRNKETELTAAELNTTADRLSAMVVAELDDLAATEGEKPGALRSSRLEFMIRALGRTELPSAVATLVRVVERDGEPYRSAAMLQLGELPQVEGISAAVPAMTAVLRESKRTETLLVAATAISLLADAGDREVIDALSEVCTAHEGEVGWSAALGLARLGSTKCKSTLLDLLDRAFWESGERYSVTDESGAVHRYPMPPSRVDVYLKAAIEAAAKSVDPETQAMIKSLASDASPMVEGAAKKALAERAKTPGG